MSKDLLFLEDNHHKKIKEKKRTLRFKTLSEKKKTRAFVMGNTSINSMSVIH